MDNAYNYTGFPATYTPNLYYQPTVTRPIYNPTNWQQYNTTAVPLTNQTMIQQQNNTSMIWIQGEDAAKSYVLPPNTTVPLWDSEASVIYIKSVDSSGKPTMTILDYVERNAPKQSEESSEITYVTKDQFDKLSSQFATINDKLDGLGNYVTKEQLDSISGHVDDLTDQIGNINNKITNMGKSQSNTNNRRGGK